MKDILVETCKTLVRFSTRRLKHGLLKPSNQTQSSSLSKLLRCPTKPLAIDRPTKVLDAKVEAKNLRERAPRQGQDMDGEMDKKKNTSG